MLTEAGFADAAFHGWTGYVTSPATQGGLVMARKPDGEIAALEGVRLPARSPGHAGDGGAARCPPG